MTLKSSKVYCKNSTTVFEPLTPSVFEPVDLNIIKLFSINIEDYLSYLNYFSSVISKTELARSDKFFNSNDKNNYIISHGILRIILSQYLGITPKEIQYTFNENKKPSLILETPFFNISHSKNCTILGFSNEVIGVDVEFVPKESNNAITLKSILHPVEIDFIKNSNSPEKEFFKIWTRKEAVFKCLGSGIPDIPSQLACIDGENIWNHNLSNNQKTFYIQSFQLEANYKCAVASSSLAYPKVKLIDPESLKTVIKSIIQTF